MTIITLPPGSLTGPIFTFYNPQFSIASIIEVEEVNNILYLDVLDAHLKKTLKSIRTYQMSQYDSSMHLSTLSFNSYGTTTLDWLILMYNGYFHELEIPSGTILKIPSFSEFRDKFNSSVTAVRRGTVITV